MYIDIPIILPLKRIQITKKKQWNYTKHAVDQSPNQQYYGTVTHLVQSNNELFLVDK